MISEGFHANNGVQSKSLPEKKTENIFESLDLFAFLPVPRTR